MRKTWIILIISLVLILPSINAVTTTFSTSSITNLDICAINESYFAIPYIDGTLSLAACKIYRPNGTLLIGFNLTGLAVTSTVNPIACSAMDNNTIIFGHNSLNITVCSIAGVCSTKPSRMDGEGYTNSMACFNSTLCLYSAGYYSGGGHFDLGLINRTGHNLTQLAISTGLGAGPRVSNSIINTSHALISWGDSSLSEITLNFIIVDTNLNRVINGSHIFSGAPSSQISNTVFNSTFFGAISKVSTKLEVIGSTPSNTTAFKHTVQTSVHAGYGSVGISALNSSIYSYVLENDSDASSGIIFGISSTANDTIFKTTLSSTSSASSSDGRTLNVIKQQCNSSTSNTIVAYIPSSSNASWSAYDINGNLWDGYCTPPPNVTQPYLSTIGLGDNATISSRYNGASIGSMNFTCYKDNVQFLSVLLTNINDDSIQNITIDSGNFSSCQVLNCSVFGNDDKRDTSILWSNQSVISPYPITSYFDINSTETIVNGAILLNTTSSITDVCAYINQSKAQLKFPNGSFYNYSLSNITNNDFYKIFTDLPIMGGYNLTKIFIMTNLSLEASNTTNLYFNVIERNAPSWSYNTTNTTLHRKPIEFSLNWTDDTSLSSYIFSWNNSGIWQNDTAIIISGITNKTTTTKTLNSTNNQGIGWKYYANDTYNTWNASSIFELTTTNTLPTLDSALIVPSNPTTIHRLNATNGATYDYDGDVITLIYEWYNLTLFSGVNDDHINSGNLTAGSKWYVKIYPNDGIGNGSSMTSQTVTINSSNEVPVINTTTIKTSSSGIVNTDSNPTHNISKVDFTVEINDSNAGDWHKLAICKTDNYNGSTCLGGEWCYNSSASTNLISSCTFDPDGTESYNNTAYLFVRDWVDWSSSIVRLFYIDHPRTISIINNGGWVRNQTLLLNSTTIKTDTSNDNSSTRYCFKNGVLNSTSINTNATLIFDTSEENTTFSLACFVANRWNLNSSNDTLVVTTDWHPPIINLTNPANGSTQTVSSSFNLGIDMSDFNISQRWFMQNNGTNLTYTPPFISYYETVAGLKNYYGCANDSAGFEACSYFTYDYAFGGGSSSGGASGGSASLGLSATCLNNICEIDEDINCPVPSLYTDCDGYCNIQDDPNAPFADKPGSPDCPTAVPITQTTMVTFEFEPRTIDPVLGDIPAPFQAIGSICRTYRIKNIGSIAGNVNLSIEGEVYSINGQEPQLSSDWVTIDWTNTTQYLLIGEYKDINVCVKYPDGQETVYEARMVGSGFGFSESVAIEMHPPLFKQLLSFILNPSTMIALGVLIVIGAGVVLWLFIKKRSY
jgi:hypothetical protein